jgi:hypothetical protein
LAFRRKFFGNHRRHQCLSSEETKEIRIKDMAKKAFKAVTGGSDEDQRKDLQRKMGVPQTGKKPVKEEVQGKTLKH